MSAVQSDVSTCLVWETDRPYLDNPRRSYCFVLFGEECFLQISLKKFCVYELRCYITLFRNNGGIRPVVVSCHINATKDLFLTDIYGFNHKRKVLMSGDCVFSGDVPQDSSPADHRSGIWTVFCRLSCEIPMGNETIYLSTVSQPPVCVDRCVQASPGIPRNTESLAADMSTLLKDEHFADFELKCRDRVFRVHRNVLAARSEVFRAMFRNEMRESQSGSARIDDLEVPVLESMLKFVYTGTLDEPVPVETVFQMYQAADQYAVHSLKSACSHWMTRNLTLENCVRFLDAAEAHCDRDLRAAVVSFILENPVVMKTEAWLAFSKQRQELTIEIFQMHVSSTIQ